MCVCPVHLPRAQGMLVRKTSKTINGCSNGEVMSQAKRAALERQQRTNNMLIWMVVAFTSTQLPQTVRNVLKYACVCTLAHTLLQ